MTVVIYVGGNTWVVEDVKRRVFVKVVELGMMCVEWSFFVKRWM